MCPFLIIWKLFTFKGSVFHWYTASWRDWRGDVLHCEGRWVPNHGLKLVMLVLAIPFPLTNLGYFTTRNDKPVVLVL